MKNASLGKVRRRMRRALPLGRSRSRLLALTGLGLLIAALFASAATPGQATQFGVSVAPPTKAGQAITVTVTALDVGLSPDKSYKGEHNLTFSGPVNSPNETEPIYPETPVVFDQGVASVSITLFNAAATTLTVTDGTITGTSGVFVVTAGDAASLSFTGGQPPIWVAKNVNFSAAVTVKDTWGNFVPDHPVTVALAGGAAGLPGTTLTCDPSYCTEGPLTAKTKTSGVADFLLAVNRDSVGYYLVASGSPAPNANSDTFNVADAYGQFGNGNGPSGNDEPNTTQASTSVSGSFGNNLALAVDSTIPIRLDVCGGLQTQVGSGTAYEAVKTTTDDPQPTWTITMTVKKAGLIDTARGAATYDVCLGTRNLFVAGGGGTDDCLPNSSATSFSTSLSFPAQGGCANPDPDVSGVYWGNMLNAGAAGTNTPASIKNCSEARAPVVMSKKKVGPGDLVIKFCVPYPWDAGGGFH